MGTPLEPAGEFANAADIAAIVNDCAQILALIFGAAFAYFKFLRGRTFKYRAEVQVSGELVRFRGEPAIRVHVKATNSGLSKIPLHPQGGAWIEVSTLLSSNWQPGEADWDASTAGPAMRQ